MQLVALSRISISQTRHIKKQSKQKTIFAACQIGQALMKLNLAIKARTCARLSH